MRNNEARGGKAILLLLFLLCGFQISGQNGAAPPERTSPYSSPEEVSSRPAPHALISMKRPSWLEDQHKNEWNCVVALSIYRIIEFSGGR
jgi:hypothetical protein